MKSIEQIRAEQQERICTWLIENGLDPMNIPVDHGLQVDPGQRTITINSLVRDDEGNLVLDSVANGVAKRRITVPLVTEPPVWLL